MPLKDSTETKRWAVKKVEEVGSLGKRIKLALANSLMHYLPSTL
jgi:hypothetical protein